MSIISITLNCADVRRSAQFYAAILEAKVIDITDDRARLEVVDGRLDLVRLADDAPGSEWEPDDLQRGFRHIGFKVESVNRCMARVAALGAPVHLEPLEATGGVRIAFFFDPDGTLVEVVERHLSYDEVLDADAVAAEQARPTPRRARLDHVAVTVENLTETAQRWAPLGHVCAGALRVPGDPRGFDIHYLHDGGVVLEVFTYRVPTRPAPTAVGAPGFDSITLDGRLPTGSALTAGSVMGDVFTDPDGLRMTQL